MAFISNREDQLLISRLDDLCFAVEKYRKPCFLGFLDERQKEICHDALKRRRISYHFWGGYEDAERTCLGLFAGDIIKNDFPIACVELKFRPSDQIGHRDILGSLMGLNLKREAMGDIVVEEGKALLFVSPTVLPVILLELDKVGRCGVKCRETTVEEIVVERRFENISGTIASLRLDCTVAFLARCSRTDAVGLIRTGKVALNGVVQEDISRLIAEGCKVSVRGTGKFIYDGQHGTSKKDKLKVSFRRYS